MSSAQGTPNKDYGFRLKEVRKFYKLNQIDFGSTLGITNSMIGILERGDANITISHMRVLHDTYKINLNWLISGQGNMILDDKQPSLSDTILSEIDPNIGKVYAQALEDKERLIMAQEQLIEMLKKGQKP